MVVERLDTIDVHALVGDLSAGPGSITDTSTTDLRGGHP
jgi:hypothetical protein